MSKKIAKLMKNLDITEEEAMQLIEDDKRIDRGENLFELSDEQKAIAKKASQADRAPIEGKIKREHKENADKQTLINSMGEFFASIGGSDVCVLNKEREMTFVYNNVKYKIVLSVPRS